jgi:hypothetical protein
MNNQYDTLIEALEDLNKKGFTGNFHINEKGLTEKKGVYFEPTDVKLIEFHRFEGITNPSDMSILYAIETNSGLKGTVVDSYGVDGSEEISKFMNRAEQKQFD